MLFQVNGCVVSAVPPVAGPRAVLVTDADLVGGRLRRTLKAAGSFPVTLWFPFNVGPLVGCQCGLSPLHPWHQWTLRHVCLRLEVVVVVGIQGCFSFQDSCFSFESPLYVTTAIADRSEGFHFRFLSVFSFFNFSILSCFHFFRFSIFQFFYLFHSFFIFSFFFVFLIF